jgi:acetyl-CoA decarbonylase/synthase complex subunit gamma
MSFDRLREALPGRDAWILVLDTRGINVWCAAGKGTFGTAELVTRLESTGLARIISHRDLILPPLGGSGIAAHEVKRLSGFSVIYGPIRARDLPAFLDGGLKATTEMRRKTFTIWERIVLIPVELVAALKWALILTAVVSLLGGLLGSQGFLANVRNHGAVAALVSFMAVVAGAVLTPLLLPWLPGRAFSLKGLSLGLAAAAVLIAVRMDKMMGLADRIELLGWIVLMPAMAAYLAMNFTGASTYTSLSGVKKEMRWAIPLVIAGFVAGLGLWVGSRFVT